MNGATGAGQTAAGGVGGAMAATTRPASVPAIAVNQQTLQPMPSTTDRVIGGLGAGLKGFGDLMNSQTAPAGAPRMNLARMGGQPVSVANYTLPAAEDPFSDGMQNLDPNMLRALLSGRA